MKAITISLVGHLVLVTTLLLASILAPDLLPTPRSLVLAFHDTTRIVRLVDIELPTVRPAHSAQSRGASPSSSAVGSLPGSVPLSAPAGVGTETDTGGSILPGASLDFIGTGSGFEGPAIPGVVEAPPPPTSGPIRLHSGVDAPRKVAGAVPTYPALARSSRVTGAVIIEATIDERGNVAATRILRSIPLLDQAAVDAVRSWKYEPARLNGQPVAVLMTVTVNFALQ
jgi:protein TonB